MRRLIDTLIFVLVAYSICWPVARSLTRPVEPSRVSVTIAGCSVVPSATVRLARSEADADANRFVARGLQQAGVAGASVDLSLPVSEHPMNEAWAVVEFPGSAATARSVDLNARTRPIAIELPADVPIVTGIAAGGDRLLRITLRTGATSTRFEVPCDGDGRFVFALPPVMNGDAAVTSMEFDSLHGERIAERAAPRSPGVHELGNIGD